jgi:Uma2 family endonuclease
MSTVVAEAVYHKELIDGREIEKPLPKDRHAFIQTFLGAVLATLPKSYRAATELNVVCGSDQLVPDVLVAERSARYENGDLADPPTLAVEIISPGQTLSDFLD